jgi:hypothetical protein
MSLYQLLLPYLYWPAVLGYAVIFSTQIWALALAKHYHRWRESHGTVSIVGNVAMSIVAGWCLFELVTAPSYASVLVLAGVVSLVLSIGGEIIEIQQTKRIYGDVLPFWYTKKPSVRLYRWWQDRRLRSS